MSDTPQAEPGSGTIADCAVVPATTVPVSHNVAVSQKPKKVKLSQRLASGAKKLAWRATGAYVWWLLLVGLFRGAKPHGPTWSERLGDFLSSAGFTPIDTAQLART